MNRQQIAAKKCTACGISKPKTEFHKNKSRKGGLHSVCKTCMSKKGKSIYRVNRKKILERHKKYKRTEAGKSADKKSRFKYKYGIAMEEHRLMYVLQNGKCAICGQPTAYNKINTDHDHKTGKVRGLLCRPCNLGLGSFKDNPKSLRSAARYLKL